jgi:hypothetical protein
MERMDFMAEEREDLRVASMDSHHMPRPAPIPELSAVSIMEELPTDFPHAGSRASVEVSTAAAFMGVEVSTAAVVIGDSFRLTKAQLRIWRKSHAHEQYET